MNNMGGYKSVTLYPVDGLTVTISDSSAHISSSSGGILLPLSEGKASLASADNGDGSFRHDADISLKVSLVDVATLGRLRQFCRLGCLPIATDFNGRQFLFGDKVYPMTGSVDEQHGKSHSDLHFLHLELSCHCLHPELLLI